MADLFNQPTSVGLRRQAAWELIYEATLDRSLADDWCHDLSLELGRSGSRLEAADVIEWLNTPLSDRP
jgi:hypothetical protein